MFSLRVTDVTGESLVFKWHHIPTIIKSSLKIIKLIGGMKLRLGHLVDSMLFQGCTKFYQIISL